MFRLRYVCCAVLGGCLAGRLSALLAEHLYLAPLRGVDLGWCGTPYVTAAGNACFVTFVGFLLGIASGLCAAKLSFPRR